MYVEASASIRTKSVCDPTLTSWGFGGAVSTPAPAGSGAEPRKQTHFWQQSIENWLKIRSLTSHVGKYESTYFNISVVYRHNKKIVHNRFLIEISRIKSINKIKNKILNVIFF